MERTILYFFSICINFCFNLCKWKNTFHILLFSTVSIFNFRCNLFVEDIVNNEKKQNCIGYLIFTSLYKSLLYQWKYVSYEV